MIMLEIHLGDRTSRQKRVAELLNYAGLAKSSLTKYAHEFSKLKNLEV